MQSYCVAFSIVPVKLTDLMLLIVYLPPTTKQPLVGQGLPTPHPVGLLWASDQQDADLTTYNTYKRQTSTPSAGFEPAIPTSEWSQTQALDLTATGIGFGVSY